MNQKHLSGRWTFLWTGPGTEYGPELYLGCSGFCPSSCSELKGLLMGPLDLSRGVTVNTKRDHLLTDRSGSAAVTKHDGSWSAL